MISSALGKESPHDCGAPSTPQRGKVVIAPTEPLQ